MAHVWARPTSRGESVWYMDIELAKTIMWLALAVLFALGGVALAYALWRVGRMLRSIERDLTRTVDEVVPVSTPDSTSMILVTPVSGGPVYVTRVETELGRNGPMLGLAPLLPIRATTLVPPVESVPGSAVLAGP